MPTDAIGSSRSNAIYRLLFLVINIVTAGVIYGLVATVGFIGGAVFMVIDILTRLITNSKATLFADWGMRLFSWPVDMLRWLFFGTVAFPWLP